ncbi:MAG: hypothetical protein LBT54_02825 [Bifidobacteriaceae bacterium]|jgi:hypothetical protein|nr:hypothetical protein [Bifidobacteriaceae bacterium]
MPYTDVEGRLRTALTTLILDEYSLLETVRLPLPASERVIAHQIGWRLRTEYERSWDIDVEYNRVGHGSEGPGRGEPVDRPVDISVHHRGMTGPAHNLMVIELKTNFAGDLAVELHRLGSIAKYYRYQHACLLDLGITLGDEPNGPPVLVCPTWVWLPGGEQPGPVFPGDAARQLSADGWEARQRRYPVGADRSDLLYEGWQAPVDPDD